MKNIAPEICRQIGQARREQGISQSTLAREMGCKQPALSMFESGDGTKLSEDVIKKLAERFGVALEPVKKDSTPEENTVSGMVAAGMTFGATDSISGFCPSAHCLSNVPYVVAGHVLLQPRKNVAAPFSGAKRCAICGEVLETRCPSCGAPLNNGACCAICGMPYVTATLPAGVDALSWVRTQRAEIAELRSFQSP